MEHDKIKELLPLAAIDKLDPDQARIVAEHLASGCRECRQELEVLKEAAALIAMPKGEESEAKRRSEESLSDQSAPQTSTADAAPKPAARAPGAVWPWRVATGAALAVAVLMGLMLQSGTAQLRQMRRIQRAQVAMLEGQALELSRKLNAAQAEIAELSRVLDERMRLEGVLMAPDARIVRLEPVGPAKAARATVVISHKVGKAVIDAAGLPQPPPGKTYQLWWITKQRGPVPAGTFTPAPQGETVAPAEMPPGKERMLAAAVTLEPTPGMPKPTGEMYLKGSLAEAR